MNNKPVIYYVEGECEKKLINSLKDKELLIPGHAEVFNVLEKKLTISKLTRIKPETTFIMVFDTDTENDLSVFNSNCALIVNIVRKPKIFTMLQVKNFEEELVRSTNISQIKELTGSKSNSDFKNDFLYLSDCFSTLKKHSFDLSKIWNTKPSGVFRNLHQDVERVLIK